MTSTEGETMSPSSLTTALQAIVDGYSSASQQIAPTAPLETTSAVLTCSIQPELLHRLYGNSSTSDTVQLRLVAPIPAPVDGRGAIVHVSRQGVVVAFPPQVTTPASELGLFAHNQFVPYSQIRTVWAAGTSLNS